MKTNFFLEKNNIQLINQCNLIAMPGIMSDSVQLTVTSPPYDDLRTYKDSADWTVEKFKQLAQELYRVTKPGGVVVWVVGDATKNGSESGSSFKQALYFMEMGFKLHDTMIYEKNSSPFPASRKGNRYTQIFEYMFVFSKGKPSVANLLCDKRNKWAGHINWGVNTTYTKGGDLNPTGNMKPVPEFSPRNNIWKYTVGFNKKSTHPAVFPEKLALDHILSWSNEGDVVFDPFMGSGTTGRMAIAASRCFTGIELSGIYFNEAQVLIDEAYELYLKSHRQGDFFE